MCPIEELNLGNIYEVEESFEILKIHEVLEKISLFLFAFQKNKRMSTEGIKFFILVHETKIFHH